MNKDLKKFIIKLGLLSLAVTAGFAVQLFAGMFIVGSQYKGDYDQSLIDKISRLESIHEPKIILVGNSNLSFGMDSPRLQEAMNMPVVNLGLHGGLGNALHENMAELNINSGDIVVICHSYYGDNGKIQDLSLAWVTVEYNRELWRIIRREEYPDMLFAWPNYCYNTFLLWATFMGNENADATPQTAKSSYTRAAFNSCGDVVFKPEKYRLETSTIFKPGKLSVSTISDTCVDRLNVFNRYIMARGAVMLVAGYPIAYGEYTPPAEEYDAFQKELAEKLDCEIISDYRDYFIPYEYFYDTVLHLDGRGTEIRTSRLIKDLLRWKAKHS